LLALGLAGVALMLSSTAASPAKEVAIGGTEGLQGKASQHRSPASDEASRAKLVIQGDLKELVKGGLPWSAKPGSGGTVVEAAAQLFDHVVKTSGLHKELTSKEEHAFKLRFTKAVRTSQQATKYWIQDYADIAGEKLELTKPIMTEALAASLNSDQRSFKLEMRDWMVHETKETFSARLGRTPLPKTGKVADRTFRGSLGAKQDRDALPASFDARDAWPECEDVIGKIHNQGRCGSCWVFGALGSLDSRLCIKTNASFSGDLAMLSRGFGASCTVSSDGCMGGWEYYVFEYIEEHAGIPSTACVPYFAGEDYADHWSSSMPAPSCPDSCDARYTRAMPEDMFKPLGIGAYKLVTEPDEKGLLDMRAAIYEGGTIPFGIYANGEFMGYSSGIFDSCLGYSANHAVQAIGWGVGYILGQNSWGDDWGDAGRFKIAPCVVTDFTVPGDITEEDYPLPIPTATFTTSTTKPPPVVTTFPCVTGYDGCVTSPGWPGPYGNNQRCDISYEIGKLNVTFFEAEAGYDYLEVNGKQYSGWIGPQDVVPYTNLLWSSDSTVGVRGWKICPASDA